MLDSVKALFFDCHHEVPTDQKRGGRISMKRVKPKNPSTICHILSHCARRLEKLCKARRDNIAFLPARPEIRLSASEFMFLGDDHGVKGAFHNAENKSVVSVKKPPA